MRNNYKTVLENAVVIAILTLVCISSCRKPDDKNIIPAHCTNGVMDGDETGIDCGGSCNACTQTDVYIAGQQYTTSPHMVARYWKNGVAVDLTDGTNDANVYSITVVGNDVYVAGFESNGTKNIAKYWKNGTAVNLTDGTNDAMAGGIVVSDGDVYVAGVESNGTLGVAKYWKNGVAVSLPSTYSARALTIAIAGGDVHVGGFEIDSSGHQYATYWKNGIGTTFDTRGALHSIVVSGSDVYAVSDRKFGINNVAQSFQNSDGAVFNSVFVSGTDVYLGGSDFTSGNLIAAYWKNGTETKLTNGPNFTSTGSVFAVGDDIYVVGAETTPSFMNIARCWKNNVPVSFCDTTHSSSATSVFVVQH